MWKCSEVCLEIAIQCWQKGACLLMALHSAFVVAFLKVWASPQMLGFLAGVGLMLLVFLEVGILLPWIEKKVRRNPSSLSGGIKPKESSMVNGSMQSLKEAVHLGNGKPRE